MSKQDLERTGLVQGYRLLSNTFLSRRLAQDLVKRPLQILASLSPILTALRLLYESVEFDYFSRVREAGHVVYEQVVDRSTELRHASARMRGAYLESVVGTVFLVVVAFVAFRVVTFYGMPVLADGWRRSSEDLPLRLLDSVQHLLLVSATRFGDIGQWAVPGAALCFVVVLVTASVTSVRRLLTVRWTYLSSLKEHLLPVIRTALSELAGATDSEQLLVSRAPGLSSDATLDRVVDRTGVDRIRSLISDHGASAVAISGPRGCGKTVMLRAESDPEYRKPESNDPQPLRIMVRAPVSYDAREFVIHTYLRLCDAVLDAARPRHYGRRPVPSSRRAWLRRFLRVCLFVLALGRSPPTSAP